MELLVLGRLALNGSRFRRQKPLLLLAFLALEGARTRRYLAELFWPGASDNLNSLSVALSQLRRGTSVELGADDQHVWVELDSDAAKVQRALSGNDPETALALYHGPFLDGADSDLGEELEEWVYQTREQLAGQLRDQLLQQAEAHAAVGRFLNAASLAERAWQLNGAAEPEPEQLTRFALLFAAGGSQLLSTVEAAAAEYGIPLSISQQAAEAGLRRQLLGRDYELNQLGSAAPGSWNWLQGNEGMGKTTLLRQLRGTYLPARSGLPYASLEPLLAGHPEAEPPAWRQLLSTVPGVWLIDDWEQLDEASRALLSQLRSVHVNATVIISSTQAPPFPADQHITIGPLPSAALEALEQGWERTGGLPRLVAAALNGQSVTDALPGIVKGLSRTARLFLETLSLLDSAEPAIVRQALSLSAADTAGCLSELRRAGLLDNHGEVRASAAIREWVRSTPAHHSQLSLKLARCLPPADGHPYWWNARALWEDEDLPAVQTAFLEQAAEQLHRGFPITASETLARAPQGDEVHLLHARALERAGLYRDALTQLDRLQQESPAAAAVRAAVLQRLSRNDEALAAALLALEGGIEDRAWGHNTIGMLEFTDGRTAEAAASFRRSAALWHVKGDRGRRADALNNLAVMQSELGEDSLPLFAEAEQLAAGNITVLSRVLLNRARVLERDADSGAARAALREAALLTERSGDVATAARIYNNLGALEHRLGELAAAAEAYRNALELAAQAGEQRLQAVTLANLAELEYDHEAWQEAVLLFEEAGFSAQELFDELPTDHPFRLRSD